MDRVTAVPPAVCEERDPNWTDWCQEYARKAALKHAKEVNTIRRHYPGNKDTFCRQKFGSVGIPCPGAKSTLLIMCIVALEPTINSLSLMHQYHHSFEQTHSSNSFDEASDRPSR